MLPALGGAIDSRESRAMLTPLEPLRSLHFVAAPTVAVQVQVTPVTCEGTVSLNAKVPAGVAELEIVEAPLLVIVMV